MCLIVVALRQHPRYPIVLAANRDEYFDRPSQPAAYWHERPYILAGRDLLAGGTWLGITRNGRFAAVANYRDPRIASTRNSSRGRLVSDFLQATSSCHDFLTEIDKNREEYAPFNLVLGDGKRCAYYANTNGETSVLSAGMYGISNAFLDTPWPKVIRAKRELRRVLDSSLDLDVETILALLHDTSFYDDAELPDTGVGIVKERMLAPIFIRGDVYGTRCSSVLTLDNDRQVTFIERSFSETGAPTATTEFRFTIGSR